MYVFNYSSKNGKSFEVETHLNKLHLPHLKHGVILIRSNLGASFELENMDNQRIKQAAEVSSILK